MLEFRRALYRIALSTVAMLEGADYALDPKFDEARRYIRNPKTGERVRLIGRPERGAFMRTPKTNCDMKSVDLA